MKKLVKLWFLWILLFPVFSQEQTEIADIDAFLFMDIPVVTATLTEIKASEAPSNMTVISASDIEAMGCQTLVDILEKTDGIIVTRNSNGLYLLSMRGIASKNNNDKIKFLLNGHTMAEPLRNNFTEFFNMASDNIKQVEILRGPGSCLYGTNAFAGIINVITRRADSGEGSRVSIRGGSNDTYRANYNYSVIPAQEQEFNVNADFSKTQGADSILEKDELSSTPFSAAPGKMNEAKEEKRVYADYHYKNFSLMTAYSDTEIGLPIGESYLSQVESNLFTESEFIEAKYDLKFSDNSVLSLKTSMDWYDSLTKGGYFPNGFVLYGDTNGDGRLEPMDTNRDGRIESFPNGGQGEYSYRSRESRSEILWKYKITDNNQFLLGTFYEEINFYDVGFKANFHPLYLYTVSQYTDFSNRYSWIRGDKNRKIYGGFFQDEWSFLENYYLLLSGRYDKYSDFGDTFNPRACLVWNISEKTHMKFMYGTAFKAPTMNELYSVNPIVMSNSNLDPEELESYEVNISHMFAEKLQGSLTLFNTEIENLIDISQEPDYTIPGNPLYYTNYTKTKIYGAEAEIRYAFSEGDYLTLGYQYTHGKDEDFDTDYIPSIPRQQANAGINLKLLEKLNWNIHFKYVGTQPREKEDPRPDLDAYTITDTTLNYKVLENTLLTFSVYNLFDEEDWYSPAPYGDYPQSDMPKDGRTYSVGTRLNF